jgi:hypothetical protein
MKESNGFSKVVTYPADLYKNYCPLTPVFGETTDLYGESVKSELKSRPNQSQRIAEVLKSLSAC